jgi:hypothetical protein
VWLTGSNRKYCDSAQNNENYEDKQMMPSIDLTQTFGRLIPLKRDQGKVNINLTT